MVPVHNRTGLLHDPVLQTRPPTHPKAAAVPLSTPHMHGKNLAAIYYLVGGTVPFPGMPWPGLIPLATSCLVNRVRLVDIAKEELEEAEEDPPWLAARPPRARMRARCAISLSPSRSAHTYRLLVTQRPTWCACDQLQTETRVEAIHTGGKALVS